MSDSTTIIPNIGLEEFKKAAEQYEKELKLMPVLEAQKILKYMTGLPGIRGTYHLGTAESNSQFAPFNAYRKTTSSVNVNYRPLTTYLGSVEEDFVPNDYILTLLGQSAAFIGDGQKEAPSAKLVLAAVAKSLGAKLAANVCTARRNDDGTTTADLFNGWVTILKAEIANGNVSTDNGNLIELGEAITSNNACEILKDAERSCDPILRDTDKFLYCDPETADAYNDNYLISHQGLVYNNDFDQVYLEGSRKKTTIVPLSGLSGTNIAFIAPKSNVIYGFDNMGDAEKVEVNKFSSFVLTYAAAMWFGTQFRTLDKRFLKVIKLHETGE